MQKSTLSLRKLSAGPYKKNGVGEMTGRSRGVRIRETIERILRDDGGYLMVFDFTGTGSIDFSWADEVIAKIVSRLWSNEYGEKVLILRGMSASQVENIGVALERKKLAVLTVDAKGWRIIGSLNNYLSQTLNQVMKKRRLTLRELSEEEGIGMNTSGTRLLNLYRKRLVVRVEKVAGPNKGLPHRGRPYVYQSLLA